MMSEDSVKDTEKWSEERRIIIIAGKEQIIRSTSLVLQMKKGQRGCDMFGVIQLVSV